MQTHNYNRIKQIACFIILGIFLCFSYVQATTQTNAEDFLFELGKKFYDQGDYDAALRQFNKVLFLNPSHTKTLEYIKLIKAAQGIPVVTPQEVPAVVPVQIPVYTPPEVSEEEVVSEVMPEAKEEPIEEPTEEIQEETIPLMKTGRPVEYVISEEDVLDLTVWQILGKPKEPQAENKEGEEEYTISKGDVLDVSVWRWPDLAKNVIVRPDGKISFPLVGDIEAEGLTLTQLDDILTTKLTEYIREPQISVMVQSFGSFGRGRSQAQVVSGKMPFERIGELSGQLIVRPDGKVSVPLVGEVQATGLTLNELQEAIKESLNEYIEQPKVSIAIRSFGGRKIVILGEVSSPGVYRPPGTITAVEAIALAGGYTEDAVLKSVLVVRGELNNPEATRIDLNKAIKKGDLSDNIMIEPRDIVYVPRNFIKDVNYFLSNILEPLTMSESAVGSIKAVRLGPSPKK